MLFVTSATLAVALILQPTMSNVSSTLVKLLEKWARKHLVKSMPDPVLREKLTPNFLIGCKRILISNDYLPSLCRSNVELVTDAIAQVRERSIVTARPVVKVNTSSGDNLMLELPES
jgi:cation diffusion facilitator CzcD-associated flavoprotein CzcO